MRLATTNLKGGVGKTTTTVNVAHAAAAVGRRVLLVDGDPQGNASTYLTGLDVAALAERPTWGDVLARSADVRDVIIDIADADDLPISADTRATWAGVHVLPSSRACRGLDATLSPEDLWGLRDVLDLVADQYDVILIDCPPHLGRITLLHLYAVDRALIVTDPATWAVAGITEVATTVAKLQRSHPQLRIAGVLINRYDRRRAEHTRCVAMIQDQLADSVLGDPIPSRTVVENAAARHLPVAVMPDPGPLFRDRYADLLARLEERTP